MLTLLLIAIAAYFVFQTFKSTGGTDTAKRHYSAWKPDQPDHRDMLFSPPAAPEATPLRAAVDPLGKQDNREDQGQLGSCTGQGSTTALEIIMGWFGAKEQLSRLFAYYQARKIEGTVYQDSGAQIRDAIKGLVGFGAPQESYWPYIISRFARHPSRSAYAAAAKVKAQVAKAGVVYERVANLDGLLHAINANQPVVFGFLVPQQFETLDSSNFVLQMPNANEAPLGGHCVCADGYDMDKKLVWVQNSWGRDWGFDGYFQMPFEWFTDPHGLVQDMWTMRKTAAVA